MSTSMPRYVRHVVGPSRLCSAIGTPSTLHVRLRMSSASAQLRERGGPIMMKSSK